MHSFTFDNVIITLVNFVKISHPSLTIIYWSIVEFARIESYEFSLPLSTSVQRATDAVIWQVIKLKLRQRLPRKRCHVIRRRLWTSGTLRTFRAGCNPTISNIFKPGIYAVLPRYEVCNAQASMYRFELFLTELHSESGSIDISWRSLFLFLFFFCFFSLQNNGRG